MTPNEKLTNAANNARTGVSINNNGLIGSSKRAGQRLAVEKLNTSLSRVDLSALLTSCLLLIRSKLV